MLGVSGEREGDSGKPSLAPLPLIVICLAAVLPVMPAIPALRCIVSTPPPSPPPPPPSPRRRRQNHALPSSLRGFYKHQESHVLFRPGEVGRRPLVGRPLVGRRGEGRREPEEENGTAPPALPPFSLLWLHSAPFSSSFGSQGHGCRDRLCSEKSEFQPRAPRPPLSNPPLSPASVMPNATGGPDGGRGLRHASPSRAAKAQGSGASGRWSRASFCSTWPRPSASSGETHRYPPPHTHTYIHSFTHTHPLLNRTWTKTWRPLSLSLSLLVISLLGRNEDLSEAAAEAMVGALERLIDPDQMGARYKALAIASGDTSGEPGGQAADPPPGGFEY